MNATTWTAMGPAPVINSASGAGTASGRVAAVAVHPTDPNTIYIGAAGGGVWKTTDGGVGWTPLTDTQTSLETGAIALAPSNPNIIYVGTGEANFSRLSFYGRGILKSTDAGANWSLMGSAVFDRRAISRIVVHPTDPNTLFAASVLGYNGITSGFGVWRSTDGGVNWTNTTAAITTTTSFTDVVMDPTNPNVVYAAVGGRFGGAAAAGVYKTSNALAASPTWALVGGGLPSGTALGRITLAIAPSNNQIMYTAIHDPATGGVYRWMSSANGGGVWTDRTANLPSMGNLWYSNNLTVDPANPNTVYFSGTTVIVKSTNGGGSFTNFLTGADGKGPHVDFHAHVFNSAAQLLAGSDGGIYRYNPAANLWSNLNGNLNTIQFIGIALDPTTPEICTGGTQDNGTLRFFGNPMWQLVEGGDGGMVRVDPLSTSTMYRANPVASFGSGAWFRKSTNGGLSWSAIVTGITNASSANFYAPFVIDPAVAGRVLLGTNVVNVTLNGGANWTRLPGDTFTFPSGPDPTGGTNTGIDCIMVGPATPNTIYASAAGNVYVTTNNGTTWTPRNIAGAADHFNQIAVDPTDSNIAYIVRDRFNPGGHVFRTINAGVNWTDITSNLPDLPTNCIRLDANGPGSADDVLFVGMDQGVYKSTNLGASWTPVGSGLPNARVVDMDIAKNLGILAVGTHGRGLWEISLIPSTGACCLPNTTCIVATAANCATQSGSYRGDNAICTAPTGTPQTFNSLNVPIPLPDLATSNSTLAVSGFVGAAGKVAAQLNISHTYIGDLQVSLISPVGATVQLIQNNGDGGQSFTNTTFDDNAATWIFQGTAPFTGSYKPMGALSTIAGVSPNGTWTLRVIDVGPGDTGTLNSWSIAITPARNVCCKADFNQDGHVSVQDIFAFLGAFFAQSPTADFNGSGTVTVQDIFDFLAAYFAGCA